MIWVEEKRKNWRTLSLIKTKAIYYEDDSNENSLSNKNLDELLLCFLIFLKLDLQKFTLNMFDLF